MGQVPSCSSGTIWLTYQSHSVPFDVSIDNFPDWPTLESAVKETFGLHVDDTLHLHLPQVRGQLTSAPYSSEWEDAMQHLILHLKTQLRIRQSLYCTIEVITKAGQRLPARVLEGGSASQPATKQEKEEEGMVDFLVGSGSSYHTLHFPSPTPPSLAEVLASAAPGGGQADQSRGFELALQEGNRSIRITNEISWRRIGWPAVLLPYKDGKKPSLGEVATFELVEMSVTLPEYSSFPAAPSASSTSKGAAM